MQAYIPQQNESLIKSSYFVSSSSYVNNKIQHRIAARFLPEKYLFAQSFVDSTSMHFLFCLEPANPAQLLCPYPFPLTQYKYQALKRISTLIVG